MQELVCKSLAQHFQHARRVFTLGEQFLRLLSLERGDWDGLTALYARRGDWAGLVQQLVDVVDLTDAQLAERLSQWTAPAPRYTTGVLAKYARLVSDASVGAVTDLPPM